MRRRIIICLALLLALCLLGDAIALVSLDRSIDQFARLIESHRIQSMRLRLVSAGVSLERDLLAYLVGIEESSGTQTDTVQCSSVTPQDGLQRFRESRERCNRCHHEPAIRSELEAVLETFHAYEKAAAELMARAPHPDPVISCYRARHDEIEHRTQELASELVRETTELADRAGRHLTVRSSDAITSVRSAWIALTVTMVAVLIVGGLIAAHLERRLTRPVTALLEGIDKASRGDHEDHFAIDADEEFRALGHAFDHAYRNLNAARDSVLQAEKMAAVGRLAAGVAHEVGNPLASISSIAQVMRRRGGDPEQDEHIDLILEEIGRISRTVRELLTFSRPVGAESGGHANIAAVLDRATTLLKYDRRAKSVQITCECDSVPEVQGNPDRLLLVATNIVINALDALETRNDGTGVLTITGRSDGDQVVVTFEDNGIGMTEDQIASAFEPFFTTKEPGVGTGLGLWVCYQTIQRHGGTITLESVLNEGTTVTVRLAQYSTSDASKPVRSA